MDGALRGRCRPRSHPAALSLDLEVGGGPGRRIMSTLGRLVSGRRGELLAVGIIALVAAALRLYQLGTWSFWGDEIITVERAVDLGGLAPSRWSLSILLTHFALARWGVSEASARLMPALLGVATVPVLYTLVRIVFDRPTAILAAVLLAVSPWHLYWSQNARFYTSLLLFFTLAIFLFYLGLERDRGVYFLLAAICLGLAALERPLAIAFVPVAGVYLIVARPPLFGVPQGMRWRNLAWLVGPGLLAGIYLLLTFPALRTPTSWEEIFGWVNTTPFWIAGGVVFYLGIPTVCLALAGAWDLIARRNRAGLLLLLLSVLPLLGVMLLSLFQYTANRYVFISLGGWVVLAAAAATALLRAGKPARRVLAYGVVAALVLAPLSQDVLYFGYQHGNRDNWKAAFGYVELHRKEGDFVVTPDRRLGDYYLGGETLGMATLQLEPLLAANRRIWFVEDLNVVQKWPWLHEWIWAHARLVANYDVHVEARKFNMNVFLYDPADASIRGQASTLANVAPNTSTGGW